jgi:hypothetical protein
MWKKLSGIMKQKLIDFLTLFSSTSTLLCCALPALMVSLGLGATLAGIVSSVPQLIWLSNHKLLVFGLGGLLLLGGGILQVINKNAPCPLDPHLRASCLRTRQNSLYLYLVSLIIYLLGSFFAFLAPVLF